MLTINRLSLSEARILIAGALAHAQQINVPMCISIADESGLLIAFERMDGARNTSVLISQDKAFTAAGIRRGTDLLGQGSQPGEPTFGINTAHGGRMNILGGGMPVIVDGQTVGAIGVSGGPVDQDKACAEAGIAAFLAQLS